MIYNFKHCTRMTKQVGIPFYPKTYSHYKPERKSKNNMNKNLLGEDQTAASSQSSQVYF